MIQPRIRRHGFTLLELLTVMAIIAVLASLLMGAVFKAHAIKENLEARRELTIIENAIKAFAADIRFGQVGYIPSRLNPNKADGSDWQSAAYLRRLFPRVAGGSAGRGLPDAELQGHEVFVLMLGGPNNQGWSTNPQDPVGFDPSGKPMGQRIKFYDFDVRRLQDTGKGTSTIKIYCYLDRWGTPIAYFSPRRESVNWTHNEYSDDCPKLGVKPYRSQNLQSFQLISAGKDGRFGTAGDIWQPEAAPSIYPRGNPGNDDFANFSPRQLGFVPR